VHSTNLLVILLAIGEVILTVLVKFSRYVGFSSRHSTHALKEKVDAASALLRRVHRRI
jgi:hypothetical protein